MYQVTDSSRIAKDESSGDLDKLPGADEIAEEMIENLEAGLESFREVSTGLGR